jgi:hypothetical protein
MAKTYNTIGTFTAGNVLTAAEMNDLGENSNNYRVPPMCQVYRSTDLTGYTSSAAISWDAEAFDTDGMWSTGTDVTINTAGVYSIDFYYYASGAATITGGVPYLSVDGTSIGEQYSVVISGVNIIGSFNITESLSASSVITAHFAFLGGSAYIINGDSSLTNQRSRLSVTWLGQTS